MSLKRALIMSGACGVLATAISSALAQESNEIAEVVIVTGSYIRGTAEDAALPVDVISAEDLAKQGSPSTLEMIKSLSVSSGVLGDTNQFDARAQGSEGSGSVNLRGFGPQRTLVLLNGRRMVSSPFLVGAVDTNFIPTAAIGRVEVLKDGAAATYGSDAIGGVVNFLTKDNLRGLDISMDYKGIEDSDGDYGASIAFGWGNDRSDVLLAAGYQHRSELLVKDRDWAAKSYLENPQGGYSASGNPHSFIPTGVVPASLPANPLGVASPVPIRDPMCDDLGGFPGAVASGAPVCYWQYSVFDALTEEEDRYQVYADYNLDITDSTSFHIEAMYADTEIPIYRTSPSYAALQTPSSPIPGQYFVPDENPGFAPFMAANPGIFPTSAIGPTGALLIANRPFALGGNPLFNYGSSEGPRTYDGYRVSVGLNGEVSEALSWDVAATYMEQNATRDGRDTIVNRYQLALLGFGGPNCNVAAAVAANAPGLNGCLWYNPFSNAVPRNPITGQTNPQFNPNLANENRELLEWMFPIVSTEQQSTIMVFDAVLSGQTGWELGGGNMGWALGAQYREDTNEATYSDLNNFAVAPCVNSVSTGIVGPGGCTPTQLAAPTGALLFLGGAQNRDLDRDVSAVFGELSLPITEGFQAQLAARYEDYGSEIGSTFDPKLSLRWQIVDAFALRGSVGTTFRGPALQQTDASSVTTLQSVAGTFRAIRTFGNPGLKPESALTFNVGALVKAGGFSASVDYWSFDFEDAIVNEPLAGLVSNVFGTGATCQITHPLAGRFDFRDTNGNGRDQADCATANITRVDINVINGPDIKTDGIDLNAQFDWEVGGGTASLGVNATYVVKYDIEAAFIDGLQVTAPFDAAGLLNYQTTAFPLPQLKGNLFAEYSNGPHNIRYQMSYIDDYEDQRTDIFLPSLATNGITISAGKVIDDTIFHDLHYLVELPWETTLSASVENLTDEDPSFARLDLSYDPFTSSAFGRVYKVGLRKRFGAD